jgi:hypothetical protein
MIFIAEFQCLRIETDYAMLNLCESKMHMEPLLFADENASEWAFSMYLLI